MKHVRKKPLPAIGQIIYLRERLETFGGFLSPGTVEIAGAGYDDQGEVFVSLKRDGRVVASGWSLQ